MRFNQIKYEFNPNIFYSGYLLRRKLLLAIDKYAGYMKGKMMDFGCGSKPYKSLFNVDEYIGVDYYGDGHSHENEQIDVFYDGKKLPFNDNTFDAVFTSEVFEHVFNLEEMIPEIYRVMKPGSYILVTCPFAIPEHEQPNDYARYSSFGLKHLMEKNKFEIVAYEKIGNHFETLVQLRITYYSLVIFPKLGKVPLIKKLFEWIIYPIYNIYGLIFANLFPRKNALYLNNLIVCRKA